jgi:hypothetical protein
VQASLREYFEGYQIMKVAFSAAPLAILISIVTANDTQAATCQQWSWLVAQIAKSLIDLPVVKSGPNTYTTNWLPDGFQKCDVEDISGSEPSLKCSFTSRGIPDSDARRIFNQIVQCVPGANAVNGYDSKFGPEITFSNGSYVDIFANKTNGIVEFTLNPSSK